MLKLVYRGCAFIFVFLSTVYSFLFSAPQPGFCRAAEDFSGLKNPRKSKFVRIVG